MGAKWDSSFVAKKYTLRYTIFAGSFADPENRMQITFEEEVVLYDGAQKGAEVTVKAGTYEFKRAGNPLVENDTFWLVITGT